MARLTPADLWREGGAVWLMEIEWAGVTYRLASATNNGRSLVIDDADGNAIDYRGGLDIAWQTRFSLFDESAAPPAISLELWFDEVDDIPGRVAAGHDLATMTCALYRWTPAMSYEERVGVFFGQAREPSYGGVAEPVRVTFEAPIYRDGAKWPEGRIVAGNISATGTSTGYGKPYPIYFGSPGLGSSPSSAEDCGGPAYAIDAAAKKVVLGYLNGSTGITLYNVSDATTAGQTSAGYESDLQGRRVYVIVSSEATVDVTEEYAVHFSGDDLGAGDLIELCARASTLRVDFANLATVRSVLNSYKFSGYIDTEVSPWEWCVGNILPLLPASPVYGPNGLRVSVWDDTATASSALASFIEGVDVTRVGPVQVENEPPINEVIVKYAPNRSGKSTKSVTVTGRIGLGDPPEIIVSPYAVASRSRMAALDAAGPMQGVRQKVITTPFVYDTATATKIAQWQIRARAAHRRVITVEDNTGVFEWLQDGQHVTYTDTELSLTDQLCIIRGRRWAGQRLYFELAMVDDVLAR